MHWREAFELNPHAEARKRAEQIAKFKRGQWVAVSTQYGKHIAAGVPALIEDVGLNFIRGDDIYLDNDFVPENIEYSLVWFDSKGNTVLRSREPERTLHLTEQRPLQLSIAQYVPRLGPGYYTFRAVGDTAFEPVRIPADDLSKAEERFLRRYPEEKRSVEVWNQGEIVDVMNGQSKHIVDTLTDRDHYPERRYNRFRKMKGM